MPSARAGDMFSRGKSPSRSMVPTGVRRVVQAVALRGWSSIRSDTSATRTRKLIAPGPGNACTQRQDGKERRVARIGGSIRGGTSLTVGWQIFVIRTVSTNGKTVQPMMAIAILRPLEIMRVGRAHMVHTTWPGMYGNG